MITIASDSPYQLLLARAAANDVAAAVVAMHLRVVDRLNQPMHLREAQSRRVAAVRQLVAGISDRVERKQFCKIMKIYFNEQRSEKDIEVRWQDYRAKVLAARGQGGAA